MSDDDFSTTMLCDIPMTRLDNIQITILDDIQSSMDPNAPVNRVFRMDSDRRNV